VIIGVVGPEALLREKPLAAMAGVEAIVPVLKPYKLAARDSRGASSVAIGNVRLGEHEDVVLICGPCSVESREQIQSIATMVKESGAKILRGGAFKPRTSPYSFQGLREEGLRFLAEARAKTGLPVVTEVMDPRDLSMVEKYADCLQVGTRNMHNFSLLKEVGRSRLPVLLKRGFSATIYDLMMSAEYILNEGNSNVVLCERGIRTFETAARYTLDLSAVPILKSKTHLPVIVDPTHALGLREFVPQMSLAAVAAGADALMIEVILLNWPRATATKRSLRKFLPSSSRVSAPSPQPSGAHCKIRFRSIRTRGANSLRTTRSTFVQRWIGFS
jgi:3-deoxy-7-phosphoheptulonate synthase